MSSPQAEERNENLQIVRSSVSSPDPEERTENLRIVSSAVSSPEPEERTEKEVGNRTVSVATAETLADLRALCKISNSIPLISPKPDEFPEDAPFGYTCAYEAFFSECGLYFPLPELLVVLMHELRIALSQLCPNVIRTVLCLQTLAEENGYRLTLSDLFHLYAVKRGRTKGTFYFAPRKGFKFFDDFPERDDRWRESYFFFPVNSFSYGELPALLVSKWARKRAKFQPGLLSNKFAEHFISFCSKQTAWDSFSRKRIRDSGDRLSRGIPIAELVAANTSSPTGKMSNLSYREIRKQRLEKEAATKAAMVTALTGSKEKLLPPKDKAMSLVPVGSSSLDPVAKKDDLKAVTSGVTEPGNALLALESPNTEKSDKGEVLRSEKKRKLSETSSGSEKSSSHGSRPKVGNSRFTSGTNKEKLLTTTFNHPPTEIPISGKGTGKSLDLAPPKAIADLMRNYARPGDKVPAFHTQKSVNRDSYFQFANKLGEMMIEYNHTVAIYEDQLLRSASPEETSHMKKQVDDLSAEVKRFQEIEEENVRIVARAEKIRPRMLQAESDLQKLEVDNSDLRDKLSKSKDLYMEALEKEQAMAKRLEENEIRLQLLEKNRELDFEKAKREGRVTSRNQSRDLLSQVKDHLVTFDQHTSNVIYAAEVKANRVMLEEILDGKIPDLKAELKILKDDEEKAIKKASEVPLVKIDPSKIDPLLADTPPEVVTETLIPTQEQVIIEDPFGSNLVMMKNHVGNEVMTSEGVAEVAASVSKSAQDA